MSGGAGGGLVRIKAGNLFRLEGQVVANGGPGKFYEGMWRGGGGSGGSVFLDVGEFTGSGAISARGGPGAYRSDAYQSGGGGGGRIAVRALTSTFTGTIHASGGVGNSTGGAGTVYLLAGGDLVGALIIVNEQQAGALTSISSPSQLVSLAVTGKASAGPLIPLIVGVATVADQGEIRQAPDATNIVLNVTGDLNLTQAGIINANCQLTVGGNLVVATNSAILAEGRGYNAGAGAGKGDDLSYGAGGGGHAGEGGKTAVGAPGEKTYGSLTEPVDWGSGGGIGIGNGAGAPGGGGGGSIRIAVSGTLSLEGRLSANGADGAFYEAMKVGGGGAGGSVWLTVGRLEGTGTISANGGNGGSNAGQASSAGGGAGGRIAVHYGFNRFAGQTPALGGGGVERGGAGTVYLKQKDQAAGRLLIGNGGFLGRATPVSSPVPFHLAVADQALVYPLTPLNLSGLAVGPGGVLIHLAGQPSLDITVLGDASIAQNGQIHANGKGNQGGQGTGKGGSGQYGAGGAGYGGAGAVSASNVAGGGTYGSESEPTDWGSGGGLGLGFGGRAPGGAGGGALRLNINGSFSVDGYLSADGDNGVFYESMKVGGGGSGGSILLRVGALSGSGYISAKGGSGGKQTSLNNAGGGGGGRIAIYYGSMSGFSPSHITVAGGTGANTGAVGTIFLVSTATPPDFSLQPLELTTGLGHAVTFVVSVTGTGPFTYQWFLDGVELPGQPMRLTRSQSRQLVCRNLYIKGHQHPGQQSSAIPPFILWPRSSPDWSSTVHRHHAHRAAPASTTPASGRHLRTSCCPAALTSSLTMTRRRPLADSIGRSSSPYRPS